MKFQFDEEDTSTDDATGEFSQVYTYIIYSNSDPAFGRIRKYIIECEDYIMEKTMDKIVQVAKSKRFCISGI